MRRAAVVMLLLSTQVQAAPSAPTNLTAARSGTQVTLNWNEVPGAVGYRVMRDESPTGSFAAGAFVAKPPVTDISADRNYFYRISAYDAKFQYGPLSITVAAPLSIPTGLKPSSVRVIGPTQLSWTAVAGADAYDLELSANGGAWSRYRVSGPSAALLLPVGTWLWRVRSVFGAYGSPFSQPAAIQADAGYVLSMTPTAATPAAVRKEYQITSRAYGGPAPAVLLISGVPAGVSARFSPVALTGNNDVRLSFDGLENLTVPGDYPFTIQATGAPIAGAVTGSLVVAGGYNLSDLHAYPNPARGGWCRIKLSLDRAPTALRIRIFDVSGALVRQVEERGSFPSFRNPSFGVYEFEWNGQNEAGRQVASEKYLYTAWAENALGEAQGRGVLTFIWP